MRYSSADGAWLDADTYLSRDSYEVACHAVGAAIDAARCVASGAADGAVCLVRPPGHHADPSRGMGFCIFNSVGVAARVALEAGWAQRVAVIDTDVHHGNGTENILAGDERALMVSFFQHPFYPYSGDQSPAANMVNVPVPAYTKGMEVRELIDIMWMPRLEAFKPEMIFISAGFDGHREDDMGQLGMVEADYAWITHRVMDIARRYSKGRIVSCLEGGYVMGPLARSVEAHVRVLADL